MSKNKAGEMLDVRVELCIRVCYPDGVIGREIYSCYEKIDAEKFKKNPAKYIDKMVDNIATER